MSGKISPPHCGGIALRGDRTAGGSHCVGIALRGDRTAWGSHAWGRTAWCSGLFASASVGIVGGRSRQYPPAVQGAGGLPGAAWACQLRWGRVRGFYLAMGARPVSPRHCRGVASGNTLRNVATRPRRHWLGLPKVAGATIPLQCRGLTTSPGFCLAHLGAV